MSYALADHVHLASLPGPDNIARRVFPNGGVGLAYENPHSPSVIVHGWLWAGAIDVPPEKAGLAAVTASMLTRGTAKRTFAQISEETESIGASLGFGSSGHTTRFTIKCLAEDLPLLLDILTDCVHHATFPDQYIEVRRGQILTAIEQRRESTQATASLVFSRLMYPDHPYGVSQLGYETSISNLSRDDIVSFYQNCYGANGMGVTIVGGVPRNQGLDLLEQTIGQWHGADYAQRPLAPCRAIEAVQREAVLVPGKAQSDVVIGWLGMRRTEPRYAQAYLADCILGQFGLMGRLGERVRQQEGLAYYAYTNLEAGIGPGPWLAGAGVDPSHVERVVEMILLEIRRLQEEPVDEQELDDNKSYIIGSLPLRLESNEGIAAQIIEMQIYGLGLDYARRFPGLIAALTAQDVIDVARSVLDPEAYVLAIAGPETEAG